MIIDFEKHGGLVPVTVQDSKSMTVLMVGFMNEAAYLKTKEEKKVTFLNSAFSLAQSVCNAPAKSKKPKSMSKIKSLTFVEAIIAFKSTKGDASQYLLRITIMATIVERKNKPIMNGIFIYR